MVWRLRPLAGFLDAPNKGHQRATVQHPSWLLGSFPECTKQVVRVVLGTSRRGTGEVWIEVFHFLLRCQTNRSCFFVLSFFTAFFFPCLPDAITGRA